MGTVNCLGDQKSRFFVKDYPKGNDIEIGFGPTNIACTPVPGFPIIRKNSGIKITPNGLKISYCRAEGCQYDAGGEPNTAAPASFPFPGLNKHAIVYRLGQQVVQSNSGKTIFIATQSAPLEICVNDDILSDNSLGMGFLISVNEESADQ